MICPKCGHQVREKDRYLMERDPFAPWPWWGNAAITLVFCLAVIATVTLLVHA